MTTMSKKFRGIWISRKCLSYLHKGFGINEVVVLSMIYSLSRKRGVCVAHNRYIAERINLTEDRVSKIITRLKREGLVIEVEGLKRRGLDTTLPNQHRSTDLPPPEQHRRMDLCSIYNKVNDNKERSPILPTPKQDKHTDLAKQLQVAIKEGKKIGRRCAPSWSVEIKRLAKELDGDTKRIETAIAWYAKNARGKGVPSIVDGKTLRRHFIWLEDAMRKGATQRKHVAISPKIKNVLDVLNRYIWPKGSESSVAAVAQISYDRIDKFQKAVWKVSKDKSVNPRVQRFADHLWHAMDSPTAFVENWMIAVHHRIRAWDDWSGDLHAMAFDPNGRKFKGYLQGVSVDYCGEIGRVEELLAEVAEHES